MGSTSSGNHLELVAPATGSSTAAAAAAATAVVAAAAAATVAADEQVSGVSKPRNVAPEHCVGGIGGCVLLFCLYAFNSMFCKEGCKTEQFSVMTCQNHEA